MTFQPPHNLEAEQSVLGGIMLNNRAALDVIDKLAPDDFYTEQHRVIYAAILALASSGKPHDFITVCEKLRGTGTLETAGGMAYVGTLQTDAAGASNVKSYANIVREKSIMRQVIAVSQDSVSDAIAGERSANEVLDAAESRMFELRQRGARGAMRSRSFAEIIPASEDMIESAGRGENVAYRTGLMDLDKILGGGLTPTDLIIVAGRPSMGKSALAQNIAEHIAANTGPVAFFSMEMSAEQIGIRSISAHARIGMGHLKEGTLSDDDYSRMASVGQPLRKLPLNIDETPALSPMELRARARRIHARGPLSLIVVDYIQLMQVPSTRENRTNEISEISRSLKALAKELRVPVLALSQLSRGVEARDNKRPRMSDLRESGGIEQDADVVAMVYRDEYYNKQSPWQGVAEIIICKQRNGATGDVKAAYIGEFCKFESIDPRSVAEITRTLRDQEQEPKRRGLAAHLGQAA